MISGAMPSSPTGAGRRSEQIQLTVGHASIQTAERYLGVQQDLQDAPCDYLGIRMDGMAMTQAEAHAFELCEFFPDAKFSRTREVIQFDVGGERGCGLLVTAEAVEIRLPTSEWTRGAYDPERIQPVMEMRSDRPGLRTGPATD